MTVILSCICCGKTTLNKSDNHFIDMDIFQDVKTRVQRKIVFDIISEFSKKCDSEKLYLFNIDRFEKLELYKIDTIKIKEIVIPRNFNTRIEVFKKRDMENYGAVREKHLQSITEKFSVIEKLSQEYSDRYGVPVFKLEDNEFLSDFYINK